MNLKQKKLFIRKEFKLEKDLINIKYKNLTGFEELNIPYEEIDTSKIVKQKKTENILLIITIIFGCFLIINLLNPDNYNDISLLSSVATFLFLVTLISGLLTYIASKNIVLIPTLNNGYIELFRKKPSEKKTSEFILELTNRIKSCLILKYGTIDTDMPVEPQLMNLSWLKERDLITSDEFERLKSKLIKNDSSPVGFNHNL